MESFNLNNLKDVEVKERYRNKIQTGLQLRKTSMMTMSTSTGLEEVLEKI
jgi:hypothetical protein